MPKLIEVDEEARSIGLELLDASDVYDDFLIPRWEGRFRPKRFPPYRRAIIGLVGRQRRFLRAVYLLADAGQILEAVGPLRSMLEFLMCQHWLADDPERNWKLWMEDDHNARDVWRSRFSKHMPALHDAAVAALRPAQRKEGEAVAAARAQLKDEIGPRRPADRRHTLEQRASQVGFGFLYDGLYRYFSSASHPTMFAVDLLLEQQRNGLLLRAEPTTQFAAPPAYLLGALLLCEALYGSANLTPKLSVRELASRRRDLHALTVRRNDARLPNWRDLIPDDVLDELRAEFDA